MGLQVTVTEVIVGGGLSVMAADEDFDLSVTLVAVSVTAFVRFTGMAAPGPAGQGLVRG